MITNAPAPAPATPVVQDAVPIVLPAGRLAAMVQPVLPLTAEHVIRPWRAEDAAALVAAATDPAIRQWNRLHAPDEASARARIARMQARWQSEEAAIWAIAPADGPAIGLIGLGGLDLTEGGAELVYWLLPAARGRGLALTALRTLTRWALADLGLHRLTLCHSTANPASCRVAEKAGYTAEGTLRSALLHADGWHDQHLHAFVQGDPI
ncbi:acetyltransferase [Kitasatospora sp. MMS16-BH015]|uniref:GNAT family N-acetyltransferase n=1 Tax=Kitasatospora sp. MMS16-BH015 TaxID=2018025 RepID=UPI000CA30336|nr:GNAT family protein [Kitasatospora sp. MMS16-BH015]AUG75633.1 acetyltransferase [Kitasatospora sp. MMS16-BH015]